MADHARHREAGNVGVRHAPRVLEAVGQPGEPGAEDEPDDRPIAPDAVANRDRGVRRRGPPPPDRQGGAHAGPPFSAAMSAFARARSEALSSGVTNALSKPLSATRQSSSNEKSRWRAACTYSSVSVVPLMRRLSVFNTTLSPASK